MHSGFSTDGNFDSHHFPIQRNEPDFPAAKDSAAINELKHYRDLLANTSSIDCRLTADTIEDNLRKLCKPYRSILFVSYVLGLSKAVAAKRFGIPQADYSDLLRAAKQSYLELI